MAEMLIEIAAIIKKYCYQWRAEGFAMGLKTFKENLASTILISRGWREGGC